MVQKNKSAISSNTEHATLTEREIKNSLITSGVTENKDGSTTFDNVNSMMEYCFGEEQE